MTAGPATVAVWVAETGVEHPEFAVNTIDDMQENWEDDDYAYSHVTFEHYLDSWVQLDMPATILGSDREQDWVREHITV